MKIWKDRDGKIIDGKEFIERWKEGIQLITPLQQSKISLFGYFIIIIGIIWGMVYSGILGQWWLLVILSGSLIITGMQIVSVLQRLLFMVTITKEVQNR